MSCRVVFSPEAEKQLVALYSYIAGATSPDIAARYTDAIVSYCHIEKQQGDQTWMTMRLTELQNWRRSATSGAL